MLDPSGIQHRAAAHLSIQHIASRLRRLPDPGEVSCRNPAPRLWAQLQDHESGASIRWTCVETTAHMQEKEQPSAGEVVRRRPLPSRHCQEKRWSMAHPSDAGREGSCCMGAAAGIDVATIAASPYAACRTILPDHMDACSNSLGAPTHEVCFDGISSAWQQLDFDSSDLTTAGRKQRKAVSRMCSIGSNQILLSMLVLAFCWLYLQPQNL